MAEACHGAGGVVIAACMRMPVERALYVSCCPVSEGCPPCQLLLPPLASCPPCQRQLPALQTHAAPVQAALALLAQCRLPSQCEGAYCTSSSR